MSFDKYIKSINKMLKKNKDIYFDVITKGKKKMRKTYILIFYFKKIIEIFNY